MSTRQYAGIDLGSNSFHMVLGRVLEDGTVRVVDQHKEYVRLAAGLDSDNNLVPEAIVRALACLTRFGERLRGLPREQIRCVGTNTLRKARNSRQLLEAGRDILDLEIEIVTGLEEARLVYKGVLLDVSKPGRRLVIDIGGGSTEVIVGTEAGPEALDSMRLGCVSTSERYFSDGDVNADRMAAARLNAKRQLQHLYPSIRDDFETAFGSSGTIKCIGRILSTTFGGKGVVTREGLNQLEQHVVAAGRVGAFEHPEVSANRGKVLAGGIAVLQGVMSAFELDEVTPVQTALREGILVELAGHGDRSDLREQTVTALQKRFEVDQLQADRVEKTAFELYQQIAKAWSWSEEDEALLRWAARLHEVGLFMGFSGYQKHSAYLIANSDMPGFSVQDQRALAALALCHRGQFSAERLARFRLVEAVSNRLAMVLRLAARLNRKRSDRPLPRIEAESSSDGLTLRFPAGWLDDHPLTRMDLESERRRCGSIGLPLTFQ